MNIHPESRVSQRLGLGKGPEIDEHDGGGAAFGISSVVSTVWEHRRLLVATTGVALAAAFWQVQTQTPLYTSTAEVVLESRSGKVVDIESVVPQRSLDFLTINTEAEVFTSGDLMLRVVDAMSLEEDPEFNPALRSPPRWKEMLDYNRLLQAAGLTSPPPAQPERSDPRRTAAGILGSKLSVTLIPNTLIFAIAVESQAPEKSAAIANTIAELYVAGQREAKFEAMEEAMGWLGNRVVELKSELETAEAAIEDYSAGATLVSEQTLLANTQRLKSMRQRQAELADAAARLRQRATRLEALRARDDFATLAAEVEDPQVSAAARALANAEPGTGTVPDSALTRFERLFEGWLGTLRADAERAEAQVAAAARSVAELERRVDGQSGDLVTLRQMEREAEATRLIYESFLSRLKEISVQKGIQQADSRILSRASPGYRSHPNMRATLVKGGMAGLFLGFLLIAGRNALRTSLLTPEELEDATGLTVIGVIPDVRFRRPDRLIAHVVEKPASGLSEAVRNLRTGIQLSNIDEAPRVVMVTSSVPDEGKSILAAALAQTSAVPDRRILLIDGDLRRQTLRKYFNVEAEAGLISLLSGRTSLAETVHRDPQTGLDLIVADDAKVTPADFFASQHFANFIEAAREDYDLIIIDTPPVLAVPETRVLAQYADAVVYSVRWNATTRRMVRSGLELLRQVNVRHIGLVLTRIDPKRMDRYGYYGYGYGSRGTKLQKYYSG